MKAIGLDIGTTSLCGIVLDAQTGETLYTINRPNNSALPPSFPEERAQNAELIVSEMLAIAEELAAKEQNIASIGVTGQMHGIVYLDKNGHPASNLITWQDARGDLPFKNGETYAEHLKTASGYGAVTHFYNVQNGLVPADAVTFCTIQDLVALTLTKGNTPHVHISNAASFGLFNLEHLTFDHNSIKNSNMSPEFFPSVEPKTALLGQTPSGIPVAVAIGDNQASVLGSVSEPETSVLVNVGTGSQVSAVINGYAANTTQELRPLTEHNYLLAGSSLCGGRAYSILENFLRSIAEEITGTAIKSAYPAMDRLTADLTPPDDGLQISTLFSGTRKDPSLRGTIEQIGTENLTMRHLCWGVMHGIVNELHDICKDLLPHLKTPPTRLIGSGNGIRNNPALAELFYETFGLPLLIPAHCEEAAFGAALFSLVASGNYSDFSKAQILVQYQS
jgi:Sugar (pentulose and hexulose) kinases